MKRARIVLALGAALSVLPSIPANAEEVVDVELIIAADVSLSMQVNELETQRRGYAAGIGDPRVMMAIRDGLHQKIALTYVEWAGYGNYRTVVPWMVIATPEDADNAVRVILETPVRGMRRTSISGAIDMAAKLFDDNGYHGLKRVIDISGDGPNNQGRPAPDARDEAVMRGIVINGLPLMTSDESYFSVFDIPDLDRFYANCVIGGPGAFVMPVNDWEQFPEAVRRKLVLELAGNDPNRPWPVVQASGQENYDCLIGEKMWQNRQFFLDMR